MVLQLTQSEQEWLRANHPKLFYFPQNCCIIGDFILNAKFNGVHIKDFYEICIDLKKCFLGLPTVYETGGKIFRAAKKLNRILPDMHIYEDKSLCLIHPFKIKEFYPNNIFNISTFMYHLTAYFYWQSYLDIYRSEPWKGEPHGV